MNTILTHDKIDKALCGFPLELNEGYSLLKMVTIDSMAVDGSGLVHGGFIFGLADHAAMIAVNHPNVVLGSAHVMFLRPVRVGERIIAEAKISTEDGKKRVVSVTARNEHNEVFKGEFTCFILGKHVLE